jgi:hypothetical protein
MRALRAFVVVSIAASALLFAGSGTAAAATHCGTERDGSRWCNAPADDLPNVTGWYGYVGTGGGPCNSNPRGTTFDAGLLGICEVPGIITTWRWSDYGWYQAGARDGDRVYVYPYTTGWRWIWKNGIWSAISSKQLTIEWRVS